MTDPERQASAPRYLGALQAYLRSIRQFPLLTSSGEFRLGSGLRRHDAATQEKLVKANLRLVVRIARDYQRRGVALEELISEGNIGLLQAAQRFDPDRGLRFVSYAAWWVRKYMLAALSRNTEAVTSPVAGGKDSAPDSRPRHLDPARAPRLRILSLEELRRQGSDDRHEIELLVPASGPQPDETVLGQDLVECLQELLHLLPAQERHILESHHGLNGHPARSLEAIGNELGCTRERVRQLEIRAIERMRRLLDRRVFLRPRP